MERPIVLYCDNKRAVSQFKELRNHKNDKNIERKYHFIRAFIQKEEIAMEHILSEKNLTDPFTKSLVEKVYK